MLNYLKPENYLPHEAPMVMLETVHLAAADQVICSVKVSKEGVLAPFLDQQGNLPAWFGLEIMAQTVGVSGGWQAANLTNTNVEPAMGMLLGTQAYKVNNSSFKLGTLLTCEAQLLQTNGQLSSYSCILKDNEQELGTARVNVWQAENPNALPHG